MSWPQDAGINQIAKCGCQASRLEGGKKKQDIKDESRALDGGRSGGKKIGANEQQTTHNKQHTTTSNRGPGKTTWKLNPQIVSDGRLQDSPAIPPGKPG